MFESLSRLSTELGSRINSRYLVDESALVGDITDLALLPESDRRQVEMRAAAFVEVMRRDRAEKSGLDAFLSAYDLSSAEGVALMCLAEALLRVPDGKTADLLIADRISAGAWERHLGSSESLFVNASTWGLMLTGALVDLDARAADDPAGFLRGLILRLGEPVVRGAMLQAMRIMAGQFVMGRDIGEAMKKAGESGHARARYSFDMLGEAAMTAADAQRYFDAYLAALRGVAAGTDARLALPARPGVSVKLSALSPRFEFRQYDRAMREIVPRVAELVKLGRQLNVPLTIDAEESHRLGLTLAVFEAVFRDAGAGRWEGFGLAVQAYQRRSLDVIDWLGELGRAARRRIPLRLVKGAYWDTEIKSAQAQGLHNYPVFTRKLTTDAAYLACVNRMIAAKWLLPQFATHNAHTVAYILHVAPSGLDFEFQRLHGMGEALYDHISEVLGEPVACRVYAPVGRHADLLPYLVRRLLENGANTSFVNRIVHENIPAAEIVRDPVERLAALESPANPHIPAPPDLFSPVRRNSLGVNLADGGELARLGAAMNAALRTGRDVGPRIGGKMHLGPRQPSTSPADHRTVVGSVSHATGAQVDEAMALAVASFPGWNSTPVDQRAAALREAADLLELHRPELVALCVAEAGRCVDDAIAESREAVDFLRYYAAEAERIMGSPLSLPGLAGESNRLTFGGRGVFACISPWNFPLAIFVGQIAAALVTGNTVIAKPAEQTSLIAARAVELLLEAGIPAGALQFLPGEGAAIGERITAHAGLCGVAFTGSTDTARVINRALAARDGPLVRMIAETGGQNAMIVDSTALIEQAVADAASSAFNSAGQRCSSLRVLFLQEEIADRAIEMLAGHVAELQIGDPADIATDIGPVIDFAARDRLLAHRDAIVAKGRLIFEGRLPEATSVGSYIAPLIVEITDIAVLREEHFGPILHVQRFRREDLDAIVSAVESTGYGLTFGLQSRIERRTDDIGRRISAGNVYVNRNIIGAAVGAQPFGGRGLSGTGPKAGGPHYLPAFMAEKTISTNTAAIGGNASLLNLSDDSRGLSAPLRSDRESGRR